MRLHLAFLFGKAFGDEVINTDLIAKALAQFNFIYANYVRQKYYN